jgi:hypothetical protein
VTISRRRFTQSRSLYRSHESLAFAAAVLAFPDQTQGNAVRWPMRAIVWPPLFCAAERRRFSHMENLDGAGLDSSAYFSTATASSLITLMSRSGRRPGFSFTADGTKNAREIEHELLALGVKQKHWNSRAALRLGAALKNPFGPTIRGVPSVG